MMADPSFLRDYKGAVALNNIGIVLLEQGAYRQALDTLKDAVFVMKVIFRPRDNSAPLASNVEVKLKRASERIASPHCEESSINTITEILSNMGSFRSINTVMLKQGAPYVFPIRIEECTDQEYDLDIDSANILHNFAIAHLCCSRTAKTLASAELFRQSASRLSGFAYNLISNVLNNKRQADMDELILRETRIFLSALVALNTLVHALMEMGNYAEAEKTYKRLMELGLAVAEVEEPEMRSFVVGAAAA